MAYPDWLPNWVHEFEYPDKVSTTLPRWTWEFLRRNQEYRDLWRAMILPYYDEETGAFDDTAAMAAAYKWAEQDPAFQRVKIGEAGTYAVTTPRAAFREKFGILAPVPPPPWAPLPGISLAPHSSRMLWASGMDGLLQHAWTDGWTNGQASRSEKPFPDVLPRDLNKTIGPNECAIIVDLVLPLGAQLDQARTILENRKHARGIEAIEPTRHRHLYQDYLRILDAVENGALHREIAAALWPGESDTRDRVKNRLRAARRLRDGGYRHLGRDFAPDGRAKAGTTRHE